MGRNYPRVAIMRGSRMESAESRVRRLSASAGHTRFGVGAIAHRCWNRLTGEA